MNIISLIGSFIGPLIGVFLGYILTKRRDRQKRAKRQKEELNRTRKSIKEELNKIKENINDWNPKKNPIPQIEFLTGCYKSSISCGSFSLLSNENQSKIVDIYETINLLKSWQKELRSYGMKLSYSQNTDTIISQNSNSQEYFELLYNYREKLDYLEDRISDVVRELQSEGER